MQNSTNHLAQITNPALSDLLQATLANDNPVLFFQELIPNLVAFAFVIGSLVFVFILLVGGIQWMTAGNDKASVEKARGRVMTALIGIFVMFSTYAIIKLIELLFGTDIIDINVSFLFVG